MIDLKGINAIIFDFGGVILNLDYMRTIRAFENLGFADFKEWYTQAKQESVFDEIEVGAINEDNFRTRIKELGKIEMIRKKMKVNIMNMKQLMSEINT